MNKNTRFSVLSAVTKLIISWIVLCGLPSQAQTHVPDRVHGKIEAASSAFVRGNIHPRADSRYDIGEVDGSFPLQHVTMMLKSTPAQQAALETLLAQQQDPSSPNYHRWLSPEAFAQRFGLSSNDLDAVTSWLRDRGFTVEAVGRTGRSITFSGPAARFKSAFQMPIHRLNINGRLYYSNLTDPLVPGSLAEVVLGFRSLNNFSLRPRATVRSVNAHSPDFTSSTSGNHFVVPADLATIYDLNRLYASGIDGRGQRIAIAGQTDILLNDIRTFRSLSGLPADDPEVILAAGSGDPGMNVDDLAEADLDIEWAGAAAPAAHIVYVNSFDVMYSLQYAVDQHVAPVVSITYGDCENNYDSLEVQGLISIGQQANAEGMTIVSATGDSGATDCDLSIATHGFAIDLPASMPYVTAVGGTEFRDAANSWNATNNASNGSALAYIPETAWNDSSIDGVPSGGGGGRSLIFSKPSWQVADGVPADNARDIPDVSLDASADHDGYLFCSNGSCVNGYRATDGTLFVGGGTSVSTPALAGIVALIAQKANAAQGNINPVLYGLARTVPSAFHDITSGGNQSPCRAGSTDCPSGGTIGFSAVPGYDLATGLGSIDGYTFVTSWPVPANAGGQVPLPITDVEQGTLRTGYIVVTPDTNSAMPIPTVTYGIVSGGVVQSQAGLTSAPLTADGFLFADVFPLIGRNLGIAIVNPGNSANSITLTLRDANGNVTGASVPLTLAPHQQVARFVSELFPSITTSGAEFVGSIRFQGSSPVAALGLRFAGEEFSTLPIVTASPSASAASVVLPQFAIGAGWATQVVLINDGSTTLSGRIDIVDPTGDLEPESLNGLTQSSFAYSLAPGAAFVLAPRDTNGNAPF